MRIRLNKDEVYEIKLPDEANLQQFIALTNKFSSLLKNFQKFDVSLNTNEDSIIIPKAITQGYKKSMGNKWKDLRDSRELFIELLKKYYHTTHKQFDEFITEHNFEMLRDRKNMSSSGVRKLREFHNIKSTEVGLTKFPSRGVDLVDVRIKEFKI